MDIIIIISESFVKNSFEKKKTIIIKQKFWKNFLFNIIFSFWYKN